MRKFSVLLASLALTSSVTFADSIAIFGSGPFGSFTGTIEYNFDGDPGDDDLFITLKNTTDPNIQDPPNLITAFVFNINGDATATLDPDPDGDFENVVNEDAQPNGTFEFGAAIGGSYNGGGNPNGGVAVGDTRTFAFDVEGTDASSLTAIDFFSELSTNPQGGGAEVFMVRFRGGEESDKVPGEIIPLPPAAWMGLAMLGALGTIKKIRSRRTVA